MGPPLLTVAPRDAIKVIQPFHGNRNKKNLTNYGLTVSQNNTLQLHTIGF
jgi:hypothetical protein